jgi:hypothetical protein
VAAAVVVVVELKDSGQGLGKAFKGKELCMMAEQLAGDFLVDQDLDLDHAAMLAVAEVAPVVLVLLWMLLQIQAETAGQAVLVISQVLEFTTQAVAVPELIMPEEHLQWLVVKVVLAAAAVADTVLVH